jgi:beta-lactamase superfamily II metal-dependent hydrolase
VAELVVRAYNVGFGDAIHVEVPDRAPSGAEVVRHLVVDVGNVLSGRGADDTLFLPVVKDIARRSGGRADLYVLSHEHLDHAQGLLFASQRGIDLVADHVWLPGSAAPDYYATHPAARKRRLAALEQLENIRSLLAASPELDTPQMRHLLANNDASSTRDCVDHLRGLAARGATYVWRGRALVAGVDHPFHEARLELWAPEEDTSIYYGRFQPLAPQLARRRPRAPAGVDARAFRRLVRSWSDGVGDNILAIDRAANNSSVVFTLEWRGWRLLFPGDAELRSWRTMECEQVIRPVDFLKVGHHGSHNATPPDEILERLLPADRAGGPRRVALVSTQHDVYNAVPHPPTLDRIRARVEELVTTQDVAPGGVVEIRFGEVGD